jgi:AbrB family looped-hinge helix DNA binding protein
MLESEFQVLRSTNMEIAKITAGGQITIPITIRKKLGLKDGNKVIFIQEESRKTSDQVKWGQKRRMEQGVVFGRAVCGRLRRALSF